MKRKISTTFKTGSTSGFTLTELIIVVAIVGIIASLAVPEYNSQRRKGFRSDAIVLLTTAVQLQERINTENAAYTNVITNLTPTSISTSPKGKYNLTIENYSSTTYTLVATATGGQANDTDCAKFKITHTGIKSALKSDNSISTSCWPS